MRKQWLKHTHSQTKAESTTYSTDARLQKLFFILDAEFVSRRNSAAIDHMSSAGKKHFQVLFIKVNLNHDSHLIVGAKASSPERSLKTLNSSKASSAACCHQRLSTSKNMRDVTRNIQSAALTSTLLPFPFVSVSVIFSSRSPQSSVT